MDRFKLPLIMYLAAGLRLWALGQAPLWYDEAFSALLSRLPLDRLVMATAGDTHPPLYYLLIWPIGQLDIRDEWVYRTPSALASIAAVWLIWQIAGRLGWSPAAQTGAALLMALAPAQLHYAQEARMYAVFQVAVLLAYLALLDERPAWFAAAGAAMLYLQNYGLFFYLVLALLYLRRHGLSLPRLAWLAVAPAIYLPWFVVLLQVQMAEVAGGYWIQPVTLGSIGYAVYMLVIGFAAPERIQALAMVSTFALLIYAAVRLAQLRPAGWLEIAALAFGPLLIAVAVSLAWRPVLLFRGLFPSSAFLILLMAWRISTHPQLNARALAWGLYLPVLLVSLWGHYRYNPINKAEGDVQGQIRRAAAMGETAVVHSNDSSYIGWAWYAPDMEHVRLADPPCGRTLGQLSRLTRQALGVPEIDPGQAHGLLAWSLGPTASACDEAQVYGLLQRGSEIINVKDIDIVQAGLWRIK